MRKFGLALMLVLIVGCSTPDRHHDLRTPDPVNAVQDPFIGFLAYLIYYLGSWLGPKT